MRVLRRGDAGPDVAEIRSILAGMDLLPPVTGTDDDYGTFDVAVEHAVRAFQQRRGLITDGIVGPATFQALKGASYHLGSRPLSYTIAAPIQGDDVFTLQERLTELGFDAGRPDGYFGPQTERALKTFQRDTLSIVREDSVREGNVGLWADTTARWTDWLRTTVGIREDYFAGRVLSDTPENSGNAQASMTSPKAGIVLGPWYKTEFYGNAGYGLHSNDIRGATITVDPIDKVTPQDRVPLLVRSKGAEPHQGSRRPHQLARGVRAGFRFGTAVRR